MMTLTYMHLSPGQVLPNHITGPFRAVIVTDAPISNDWRNHVSDWLVQSGCLYAMAWGHQGTLWDDAIDWSNLARFDYGPVPVDHQIMTTWHDKETLEEVFAFASIHADHPTVDLTRTLILHIAWHEREEELLKIFEANSHR